MQNDVPPAATGAWNPVEVTRADLEAWCARAALPPPPVGAGLSGRILQIGEHVFASWRAATPPYDFAALMAEAQDGDWLLGIDGHGTESWALHWVERRGPLLPGMQVRTGGAFAPSAVDLDAVQGAWTLIGRFDAALARGQASGRLAEGQVLAVIDSILAPAATAGSRRTARGTRRAGATIRWRASPP